MAFLSSHDAGLDVIISQLYSSGETAGISILVVVGFISITAILIACAVHFFSGRSRTRSLQWNQAHFLAYVTSLMCANIIQAIGTIMNLKWISNGGLQDGVFCATQGELKNAGNVGIAIWSFLIAVHVFNILFLRIKTTALSLYVTLFGGWLAILLIASVGPVFLENSQRGPYFGVSGYWCWITSEYPKEQTFMEYFFEFLSAGLGFVLYTLTLLRVRGNLVRSHSRIGWRLRWVPKGEAWKLSFSRDMIDHAMLNVVKQTVWFPMVYSFAIVPIALARISEFSGHHVPFWAVIITDSIFNLTGFANAILFLIARRNLPDLSELPSFDTPRKGRGVKPLVLVQSNFNEKSDFVDEKMKARDSFNFGISPFILPPRSAHLDNRVDA